MQHQHSTGATLDETSTTSWIEMVEDGMQVIDAAGDKLGNVGFVKMGDPVAASNQGEVEEHPGAVFAAPGAVLGDSSGQTLASVPVGPFEHDEIGADIPEPIRSRLLHDGYIRIDGAFLFGKDRYVLAEQIARVDDDTVILTVNKDKLAARG